MKPKPILEAEFHHEGRGPELQRIVWAGAVPAAFEYFNPEDAHEPGNLRHLRLVHVVAFAYAGEEVHAHCVSTDGSAASIHDLGRSSWVQSLDPRHLDGCSHYQIAFYDEIFDVICRDVHARAGAFEPTPPAT